MKNHLFLFLLLSFISTSLGCESNKIIDVNGECIELLLNPSDYCYSYSGDKYSEIKCSSSLPISQFKVRMEQRFKSLFKAKFDSHFININLKDGAFLFYKYRENVPEYGFHIDFSGCVRTLKRKLELEDNIYIALIYKREVDLNFVKNYGIYDDTGRELDLQYCEREGERITQNVDFKTSIIQSNLPNYREYDVNIFDKDDDFFNSKCARLAINNKDTTYLERREFFYNHTYWPSNCSWDIDYDHQKINYNCSIEENGFNSTINRTVNGPFPKGPKNSGAYLYDCHDYYMTNKSHLLYSYGNWFMIIIIVLIIIFMLVHCMTVNTYIMNCEKKNFFGEEEKPKVVVKVEEVENVTKIIKPKKIKQEETFERKAYVYQKDIDKDEYAKMKSNPPKKTKDENDQSEEMAKNISGFINRSMVSSQRQLNENLSGSGYKKPVVIDAFKEREKIKVQGVDEEADKRSLESKEKLNESKHEFHQDPNDIFQNQDHPDNKSYSISYSYSLNKKKEEEIKEIEEIIQPEPEKEPEPEPEIQKRRIYTDEELSLMKYDDALKHDDRGFCRYYWFLIQHKYLFLSSFIFIKSYYYYYPYTIRLILFFFELAAMLFFNAIFLDDKRIRKRFWHVGSIDYAYVFKNELGYSFAAMIIAYLLRKCCVFFIYLLKKRIEYHYIKDLKEKQRKILDNIFKLKVATGIFFFLILFISFWFWFYLVIFCGILRNSQLPLLFAFINSIIFYIIFILFICLVLGCVKYIGRKYKRK